MEEELIKYDTANDLDKLSRVEGMYKDLVIKRSVTGIVIVLMF